MKFVGREKDHENKIKTSVSLKNIFSCLKKQSCCRYIVHKWWRKSKENEVKPDDMCDGMMMMSGKRFVEVSIYSNFGCFLVILMYSVFFWSWWLTIWKGNLLFREKSGCIITWLQVGIYSWLFPPKRKTDRLTHAHLLCTQCTTEQPLNLGETKVQGKNYNNAWDDDDDDPSHNFDIAPIVPFM